MRVLPCSKCRDGDVGSKSNVHSKVANNSNEEAEMRIFIQEDASDETYYSPKIAWGKAGENDSGYGTKHRKEYSRSPR